MLISSLLFMVTAISLNYFSLTKQLSYFYWKKFVIVLLSISLILFISNLDKKAISYFAIYPISFYNGLLNFSNYSILIVCLIIYLMLTLINTTVNRTTSYTTSNKDFEQLTYISNFTTEIQRERERYTFIFTLIIGGIILSGSIDFLTIFLGLELQSYSAYLLAASYKNFEPSESAGLKYFLLGAMSSALIFLGLALLYVTTGTTNFDFITYILIVQPVALDVLTVTGLVLLFTGFIWKIAGAPVHAWAIDVYDAIPSKMSAVLSLVPKIGLIIFIFKIIKCIVSQQYYDLNMLALPIIVIIFSLSIGSFYGLFTVRVKRLLGYSSVLNIGFILLSLIITNYNSYNYIVTPIFYLIQYVLSTALIWLCLIHVSNWTKDNYNSPIEIVLNTQLQGLAQSSNNYSFVQKVIAICLTLLILSVAGIPPMIGFFAKFEIMLVALKSNYAFLAIVVIIASLISTVYYLNIVRNIWFVQGSLYNYANFTHYKNMRLNDTVNFTNYYFYECFIIAIGTLIITLSLTQYTVIITYLS